jgi:hypothetical protein
VSIETEDVSRRNIKLYESNMSEEGRIEIITKQDEI